METVPLQRGQKDVLLNGTHRRLLPDRTRCRLERTPKKSNTCYPGNPKRGSIPTFDRNPRIDHTNRLQIARSFACMAPTPPNTRSPATLTPTARYTTTALTTGSIFHIMEVNVASCPTTRHIHTNKSKHAYRPTVNRAATTQSNLNAHPRS